MDHFEQTIKAWPLREISEYSDSSEKAWDGYGGVYGAYSEFGKWFAARPAKVRRSFIFRLAGSITLRQGHNMSAREEYWDAVRRLQLASSLITAMERNGKDKASRELKDVRFFRLFADGGFKDLRPFNKDVLIRETLTRLNEVFD